jgi:hypothetical protein
VLFKGTQAPPALAPAAYFLQVELLGSGNSVRGTRSVSVAREQALHLDAGQGCNILNKFGLQLEILVNIERLFTVGDNFINAPMVATQVA